VATGRIWFYVSVIIWDHGDVLEERERRMQTVLQSQLPQPNYKLPKSSKRKRFSPLMFISIGVTVAIVVGAGFFVVVRPLLLSHAAVDNANCTLTVPANPLSAEGLATPYQLSATDPAQGPCNEANTAQSAFVQAVIFDPAANSLSAYEPLVIDQGTKPAIDPVVPQIPQGAVVALWYGFNGTILHLVGDTNGGNCVNGLNGSDFGQFAYCNAPNFFASVNAAIQAKNLTVPAIGTASDGQPCLTVRVFALVDMDQSDNVQTQYLADAAGRTAQLSAANQAQIKNAMTHGNPSENDLL
jgi:hypothetical protein